MAYFVVKKYLENFVGFGWISRFGCDTLIVVVEANTIVCEGDYTIADVA